MLIGRHIESIFPKIIFGFHLSFEQQHFFLYESFVILTIVLKTVAEIAHGLEVRFVESQRRAFYMVVLGLISFRGHFWFHCVSVVNEGVVGKVEVILIYLGAGYILDVQRLLTCLGLYVFPLEICIQIL